VSTGVIHCVFDQIQNLQNCFTTPSKNLGGEGASDRYTHATRSLNRTIFKKDDLQVLVSLVLYGSCWKLLYLRELQGWIWDPQPRFLPSERTGAV
jgi:hypothetical protein